jgi:hypothetical protein
MSLAAFIAINRCPKLRGAARRAAFQIADAHNEKRGDAWPGYRLMAAREGVSTKTMEIGVRMLEDAGFLFVQRRPGRSNYYRLDVEQIATLAINTLADCQPQNTASPPNPSSRANNADQSTETNLGAVQKRASAKSDNQSEINNAPILNPNAEHHGQLRKDWARELAYYRRKLNEGVNRPFWLWSNWGPPPDAADCHAPFDLMKRYGFGLVPPAGRSEESARRS